MAEALRRSGLTDQEFAARHGIGVWRVKRWSRDQRSDGTTALSLIKAPPVIRFAPVRIAQAATAGSLDVVVGPAVVRVGRDFDAALLRRIVLALGDAPC